MRLLIILLTFLVNLYAQIRIESEFLYKFGSLNKARGISISPTEEIYIADTGNNSIKKFAKDGRLVQEISGYGWGEFEFDQPYDIDAKNGVVIYVADYNNHRIRRFDRNLNLIATFQGRLDDHGLFGFPKSVSSSKFGEIFLIDGENIRCVKVNKFNKVDKTFGGAESGAGRLIEPIQVAVTDQNLIVILDKTQALIYDYYGNYMKSFGGGYLKNPTGLFADTLVYISDDSNVFVFDINGGFIGEINIGEKIYDIACQNFLLYCLTDREVLVYKLNFIKDEKG